MFNHIHDDEKRRDCKIDAECHGVKVKGVDINKSDINFVIKDNEIYYGLNHIKYLGEDAAKRIVAAREKNGLFIGIRDFMDRCGMDAKMLQSLISLGAFDSFGETDKLKLWKYFELYKKSTKQQVDKFKRFDESILRYEEQFRTLANDPKAELSMENIERELEKNTENFAALKRMKGNYTRSLTRHKEVDGKEVFIVPLDKFNPETFKTDIKEDVLKSLTEIEVSQKQFYGFCWKNPIDDCEGVEGNTFEKLRIHEGEDDRKDYPVEGLIIESTDKISKKGNSFHTIVLQDQNWETNMVFIWKEEYQRFQNALCVGNVVRLRVLLPTDKFTSFTLLSYPQYLRAKAPSKESDYRVIVLRNAEPIVKMEDVVTENDEGMTLNMVGLGDPF